MVIVTQHPVNMLQMVFSGKRYARIKVDGLILKMFPIWSVSGINTINQIEFDYTQRGDVFHYFHRCPTSRRRRRTGNKLPGFKTGPSCTWGCKSGYLSLQIVGFCNQKGKVWL
jgi:hypothetical protein